MSFKVQLLTPTSRVPTKGSKKAAGFDLYSNEKVTIKARGKALVPVGISIAILEDCYARVAPRSGLALKNGIDVGAGVIDADYRGQVGVVIFNHSDVDFEVQVGDRIAQLIFEKIYTPSELELVTNLDETERGSNGYGSSGIN